MNKQLAIRLINRIEQKGGLNYISLLGGVAQTLETQQENSAQNGVVIKKSPITSFAISENACEFQEEYKSLVLDSRERGILYFEENGITFDTQVFSKGRRKQISRLDIVCWVNKKKIIGNQNKEISSELISDLINKLSFENVDLGPFKAATFKLTSIKPKNSSIFSKYSYDQTVSQYLLFPYEYFSLSFEVSYFLNTKCINPLDITESLC